MLISSMDFIKQYWLFSCHVKSRNEKTASEYSSVLSRIHEFIDLRTVKTHQEIDDAILKCQEARGWSDTYRYKVSKILKPFFEWAVYASVRPDNPYKYSSFRRGRQNEPKFLLQSEFDFIIKDEMHLSNQDRAMLRVFWDTGIRRSELASLAIKDVDLATRTLYISAAKSKGGYGARHIGYSEETHRLLIRQIQEVSSIKCESLFLNEMFGRIDPNYIERRFRRISRIYTFKSGERKNITPHMLRHSVALRMFEAGAQQIEVMKTLGHSSAAMTALYTHMTKNLAIKVRDKYLQEA